MAATINATLKSATANSYVTLAEADAYFETVPSSTNWDDKTDDQKNRALISATPVSFTVSVAITAKHLAGRATIITWIVWSWFAPAFQTTSNTLLMS